MKDLTFIETINVATFDRETLSYHQARMLRTADAFGFEVFSLHQLEELLYNELEHQHITESDDVRCTLVYGPKGVSEVRFIPYQHKHTIKLTTVEVDEQFDYSYKWSDRTALEQLKARCEEGIEPIIVKNGLITDTTYTNIVIEDLDGMLWTPEQPLLEGTMRARLIDEGRVRVAAITIEDLEAAYAIYLINAMYPIGSLTGVLK